MRFTQLLASSFALVSVSSLSACQDVRSPEPDGNSLPMADERVTPEAQNKPAPEREAFDTLFGDVQSDLPLFQLTALDGAWRFEDLGRSTAMNQDHAPMAANCKDSTTPTFTLPAETSLELRFVTLQSNAELKQGFRQSCFAEWNINFEYVPGLMHVQRIKTGQPRKVCGLCQDSERQTVPGTTMIFDIVETAE